MMMIFMIHVMIMMIVMVMEVVIIGYGGGEHRFQPLTGLIS